MNDGSVYHLQFHRFTTPNLPTKVVRTYILCYGLNFRLIFPRSQMKIVSGTGYEEKNTYE